MRSAGNFSPEWGYLAPAPSLLRTARIVVVATAIGATAGAGVVLTLIEHPSPEISTSSVAAHAILTSAQAATAPAAPLATANTTATVVAPVSAPVQVQIPAAPIASQPVNPSAAPGVATLTEGTPAAEAAPAETPDQSAVAPADMLPQKKPPKHNGPANPANAKNNPGLGTVLRHLFTAHAGSSYYPNR